MSVFCEKRKPFCICIVIHITILVAKAEGFVEKLELCQDLSQIEF